MVVRFTFAILVLVCATALLPAQTADNLYVIRNVRVFDGETVAERQTVVISGGQIAAVGSAAAVPAGAQEIPGEGRTLLPGLMDAHVHLPLFGAAGALQQNLAFGVTTAVVMGTNQQGMSQVKQMEAADSFDAASILTAGPVATAPGGHPTQMEGGARPGSIPTLSAPGEADAFVAARVAEGSDFIKIIYDDIATYGKKLPILRRGRRHLQETAEPRTRALTAIPQYRFATPGTSSRSGSEACGWLVVSGWCLVVSGGLRELPANPLQLLDSLGTWRRVSHLQALHRLEHDG